MPRFVVSRGWLVTGWLLCFLLVSANRFLSRRLAYMLRRRGYLLSRAVIIGTNEEASVLAGELSRWQDSGLEVVGVVENDSSDGDKRGASLPVLGRLSDIRSIVQQYRCEDLVVAITAVPREQLLRLCEEVNSMPEVRLRLSSGLYELLATGG